MTARSKGEDGWDQSAQAWITEIGEHGDFGRQHVLDAVMLGRIKGHEFVNALDVGCGEGRFCRMLREQGMKVVGLDPTSALLRQARMRDPGGDYREGMAEQMAFPDHSFDLVVSYLSLIDIHDLGSALGEMTRVLKPGGTLLVANLTSFTTACAETGWVKDIDGSPLYYPVDNYLEERINWVSWRGIKIQNWHRPLSAYMSALLDLRMKLTFFAEPAPYGGELSKAERYRRVPYFLVMEWLKERKAG